MLREGFAEIVAATASWDQYEVELFAAGVGFACRND